jgi:hypothetical protein
MMMGPTVWGARSPGRSASNVVPGPLGESWIEQHDDGPDGVGAPCEAWGARSPGRSAFQTLFRAPSGNRESSSMMMGPTVWGPHAKHGGRAARGGAPFK